MASKAKVQRKPIFNYRTVVRDSCDPGYVNRVMIGTPVTGLVRIEWVQARYGQVIPVNWSNVIMMQPMDSYMPLRYEVADAQNLIVKEVIEKDFQWCVYHEHDVIIPPNTLILLNEYMRNATAPIVSGLYYTRSIPSEPLVFRGRGNSYYADWKMGDLVYVDGVPTGIVLIHAAILKEMWKDSPEYNVRGIITRRVFDTPRTLWYDPETMYENTTSGTSDLDWCTRVIKGNYIRKAGWNDFMDNLSDPRYPLIIDTRIACDHIDPSGQRYPPR